MRFSDFRRMVDFDEKLALRMRGRLIDRLLTVLSNHRPLVELEDGGIAIWFSGHDTAEPMRDELAAIAYALRRDLEIDGRSIRPSVKASSAAFPADGDDAHTLMNRALAAINLNRTSDGINRFSQSAQARAQQRFDTIQRLSQAVQNNEFELHYQPVVNMAAGKVVGAEALIRWRQASGDAISPAVFIPLMEESELAEQIGLWTISTACRDASSWSSPTLLNAKVAVNLSARQLHNPKLSDTILRATQLHDFDPKRLELELTETATMNNIALSREIFAKLRGWGVAISIDDFGSGYASFSYLKNLPFDKLKIDREFVEKVDQRQDSQAICAALIALGRGLGISVLAEGVEREQEVDMLARMGCVLFQGYYFGKPMPMRDFARIGEDTSLVEKLLPPVARSQQKIRTAIRNQVSICETFKCLTESRLPLSQEDSHW